MRGTFLIARVAMAFAILAAIVVQLRSSVRFANRPGGSGDTRNVIVNFFSYSTIESNSLSVVVLTIGAIFLVGRVAVEPDWFTTLRLSVSTYMVVTGVVYNALLRREELPQGAIVAWSNEVLHVVGPVYLGLDWFLAPGRNRAGTRQAVAALIFPIVWAIYTLVRGPFARDAFGPATHWYPYPFLNPYRLAGGYVTVSLYVIGIAAVIVGVAFGMARANRWRQA